MTRGETIIYAGSSDFGDYQIIDTTYENRPSRVLFAGQRTGQSGIALDDDPELLFDYNQRFLEIAQSITPKRVLVVGGGAFTFPRALLERFPSVRVDVVEIDPLLPELAYQYFGLPRTKRLRIFSEDGRAFLEREKETYDLIILDAFSEYTIPHALITVQAARLYQARLSKRGVMAINFIASYKSFRLTLAHQLVATFGSVFENEVLYPADAGFWVHAEQNLVLTLSDRTPLHFDYLVSKEVSTTLPAPDNAILLDDIS